MSTSLLLTALDFSGPSRVAGSLPAPATSSAPMPEQRVRTHLSVPGFSNDLTLEKWGVIVPVEGGEVRRTWIRPLLELRAKQCGFASPDQVRVMSVTAGMTRAEARRWRVDVYERMSSAVRPGYVLLLGDLWEISHELQLELMVSASVGRLCFTDESGRPDAAGYQKYCAKVCQSEARRDSWNERAQLLFYCSRDGSAAVEDGYRDLIRRCHSDALVDTGEGGQLEATVVAPIGAPGQPRWDSALPAEREQTLLFHAEQPRPSVLFSLTHGSGSENKVDQPLHQGLPVLAPGSATASPEVVEAQAMNRAFLPRGFWFFKACFSAGTAATSVYAPWLTKLQQLGATKEDPREALRYLAVNKLRPFVARLPQVALAHPDGPLGVLGHVDLAWTYGNLVRDEDDPTATHVDRNTFYDVLRMVAGGNRLGPAIASLSEQVQKLGTELAALYGERELAGAAGPARPADVDRHAVLRAWIWMRYLDLAGYLLLGDPAAQVPTSAARAIATAPSAAKAVSAPVAAAAPASPAAVEKMERAVLACLKGSSPTEIAKKEGVHPTTLARWVSEYKAAGRAALAASATTATTPAATLATTATTAGAAPRREPGGTS